MATILINDLSVSIELDQEAMTVIYGGARSALSTAQIEQQFRVKAATNLLDQARKNRRGVRL